MTPEEIATRLEQIVERLSDDRYKRKDAIRDLCELHNEIAINYPLLRLYSIARFPVGSIWEDVKLSRLGDVENFTVRGQS